MTKGTWRVINKDDDSFAEIKSHEYRVAHVYYYEYLDKFVVEAHVHERNMMGFDSILFKREELTNTKSNAIKLLNKFKKLIDKTFFK